MTWSNTLALFTSLVVLAAIPSLSVLTVITRSASLGFAHGVWVSLGIVTGDGLFILLALGGLSLISGLIGPLALLLRYGAGIYLIFLGLRLARPSLRPGHAHPPQPSSASISPVKTSSWASFWLGLSITLADQKATLFYLGFLPAFLPAEAIRWIDVGILLVTASLAVGGVKVLYALLAHSLRWGDYPQAQGILNAIASLIMITVGLVLILRP